MACGIPKQRENFVTCRIGNNSTPRRDDGGANILETLDDADKILRIQTDCERRQANEYARQRSQLPLFRLAMPRGNSMWRSWRVQRNGRQRIAMLSDLRLHSKFIPNAWYTADKVGRFRVRLDLASQPRNEHVHAAIVGS